MLCHHSLTDTNYANNADNAKVICSGCGGFVHAQGGCMEALKIAHYSALLPGGVHCPSCTAPLGDPEWSRKTEAALDTLLKCREECHRAVSCVQEASESGKSAEALVALGQEYYWGYTLEQDFQLAFQHSCDALQKHTADGLPLSNDAKMLACKLTAACYAEGRGTSMDYPKALELWTIAANLGDQDSMVNLSRMYREGLGTRVDSVQADAWLERSQNL